MAFHSPVAPSACCFACRSASAFQWEDGSPPPNVVPSGQNFSGPGGWSHWGVRPGLAGLALYTEPTGNENCVIATDLEASRLPSYSYLNGTTEADKNITANYVRTFTNQDLNVWADVICGRAFSYICELTSEAVQ